jgi:hypothetical protein
LQFQLPSGKAVFQHLLDLIFSSQPLPAALLGDPNIADKDVALAKAI